MRSIDMISGQKLRDLFSCLRTHIIYRSPAIDLYPVQKVNNYFEPPVMALPPEVYQAWSNVRPLACIVLCAFLKDRIMKVRNDLVILRTEAFLDAFNVIIFTTTSLSTFHETLEHHFFGGCVVDSQGGNANLGRHMNRKQTPMVGLGHTVSSNFAA